MKLGTKEKLTKKKLGTKEKINVLLTRKHFGIILLIAISIPGE